MQKNLPTQRLNAVNGAADEHALPYVFPCSQRKHQNLSPSQDVPANNLPIVQGEKSLSLAGQSAYQRANREKCRPADKASPLHQSNYGTDSSTRLRDELRDKLRKKLTSKLKSNIDQQEYTHSPPAKPCQRRQCKLTTGLGSYRSQHLKQPKPRRKLLIVFQCPLCSYTTKQNGNLNRHMRIHTPKAERPRPFHCSRCHYATDRKDHLAQHSKTHQ